MKIHCAYVSVSVYILLLDYVQFLTPFPEHKIPLVPIGQAGICNDESEVHCVARQILRDTNIYFYF